MELRKNYFRVLIVTLFLIFQIFTIADEEKGDSVTGFLSNLRELKEMSDMIDIIMTKFVGEKDVSKELLLEGAIKGMINVLDDPHSNYFSTKQMEDFTTDIKGEYGGVGMVVTKKDNVLTVVSPIEDTPAYHSGLKPNDQIFKIEDESTLDLTLEECVERLRGTPKTKVKVTILRKNIEKPFDVELTRDIIHLKYVKSRVLENNIGYLRLTQFGSGVSKDLKVAYKKLKKQNIKSVIFDLRNNPGGSLFEAVSVASMFVKQSPIVTVRDKGGKIEEHRALGGADTETPLIILINEGSASASEIVAGAIKDHKRGILLGEKSYGKGSVQNLIPFSNGAGLKLTIAKYFTPSGEFIHKKGIEPNIIVEEKEDYRFFEGFVTNVIEEDKKDDKNNKKIKKKEEKDKKNKEKSKDSKDSKEEDEEKKEEKEDIQLKAAINILKGIELYNKYSK